MKLQELTKVVARSKKRIGRGIGSGRGKTSGRGTKGQKARGKIPARFTGGVALYRKLPLRRGLGNPKISDKPNIIQVSTLNEFRSGSVVDLDALISQKLIKEKEVSVGVKILGSGSLKQKLKVKLPVSASAKRKIESLGGKA